MKNRKWGTALIAALLCLCMALSACSNDADNDPNDVVGQDWRTWGLVVDSGTITRNGEDTAVLVCVEDDGAYFYHDDENQVLFDFVKFPEEYGLTSGNYNAIAFEDGNGDGNTDVAIQFNMDDDNQLVLVWMYDESSNGYYFYDEIVDDNGNSDTPNETSEQVITNSDWEHDTIIEDAGDEMYVADATVGVQTYYPYGYVVMEVISDALVIYDNNFNYAVARCVNDIYADYNGSVEEFAIDYANSYIYNDFGPLYSMFSPVVDMDIKDPDNPNDLAQMDGYVYDDTESAYVCLYIYTDADGNVMAKSFYVTDDDALTVMDEMCSGVNHTAWYGIEG